MEVSIKRPPSFHQKTAVRKKKTVFHGKMTMNFINRKQLVQNIF